MFWAPFSQPRFNAVGPIRHPVAGDGVEQVLIDFQESVRVVFSQVSNHRLEGCQHLDRALEAERAGFDTLLARGLRHDRADEVIR